MIKILNDFLMFACATALVTGIVLAAATLIWIPSRARR